MTEIRGKVFKIIAAQLKTNPHGIKLRNVKLESSFLDDLGLDSLGVVEMLDKLELGLHVSMPYEELARIKTVKDAIDFVCTHLGDIRKLQLSTKDEP